MKDDRLEDSLSALKNEPIPALGSGFNSAVWTKIDRRKADSPVWFPGWRLALASAAFAAALGVTTAFVGQVSAHAKGETLGMEVFSADAGYLPSSILARIR